MPTRTSGDRWFVFGCGCRQRHVPLNPASASCRCPSPSVFMCAGRFGRDTANAVAEVLWEQVRLHTAEVCLPSGAGTMCATRHAAAAATRTRREPAVRTHPCVHGEFCRIADAANAHLKCLAAGAPGQPAWQHAALRQMRELPSEMPDTCALMLLAHFCAYSGMRHFTNKLICQLGLSPDLVSSTEGVAATGGCLAAGAWLCREPPAPPRPQVRDLLAAAQPGAMLHAFAQGILEWNQEFRVPIQVAIDLRQLLKGLPATGDVLTDVVDFCWPLLTFTSSWRCFREFVAHQPMSRGRWWA